MIAPAYDHYTRRRDALALLPDHAGEACPGCLDKPHKLCAACGAPASVVLPSGEHAMTFCASCYAVVCEIRASAQKHREHTAATSRADLAPPVPRPIQAPLFDLDAMLTADTGANTTPGADLLVRSAHQKHQATAQQTRQEALQARQEARARQRQERQEQRERERQERQEQRQTRTQERQEARQRAKGKNNGTPRGVSALTARRTRQEAQERQERARGLVSDSLARSDAPAASGGASRPRNTFNAYRGRQTHQTRQGRPDRREEREELASMTMARRSGEEGAA